MPKPSAKAMVSIVYGGDSYLNDQRVRDLTHQALNAYPDADVVELDATDADRYAFDEAVSPSLLADRAIVVLPTRTIPQGITAMLNFDADADADTNAVNMMQAADRVATGLVTFAARDSDFDGRKIKKGEILALENGKLAATGTDITKTTYRLARSMCKKDTSFVTVISGCDVSEEDAQRTADLVQAKCPAGIEVTHIHGGQPVYYYMISVE